MTLEKPPLSPYGAFVGISIDDYSEGECTCSVELKEHHLNNGGRDWFFCQFFSAAFLGNKRNFVGRHYLAGGCVRNYINSISRICIFLIVAMGAQSDYKLFCPNLLLLGCPEFRYRFLAGDISIYCCTILRGRIVPQ